MGLRDLLRRYNTLDQYAIMQRADLLLPTGRYYGGVLTQDQIQALTEGLQVSSV